MYTIEQILQMNPTNKTVFNKLVNKLKQKHNIAPFIGAGLSIPPYYGWGECLRRILLGDDYSFEKDCAYEDDQQILNIKRSLNDKKEVNWAGIKNGVALQILLDLKRYEDAADYVVDDLNYNLFNERFTEFFDKKHITNKGLSPAIKLIPKIFDYGPVLTTNYDCCVEEAYKESNIELDLTTVLDSDASTYQCESVELAITNRNRYLFKIHGDYRNTTGRVITTKEYEQNYPLKTPRASGYKKNLCHIFESYDIVFLGCSLENDRYLQIRDKVLKNHPTRCAFTFLPLPKGQNAPISERAKQLDQRKILPIWYPNDDNSHVALITILEALKHETKDDLQSSSMTLSSNLTYDDIDFNQIFSNNYYLAKSTIISKIKSKYVVTSRFAEVAFDYHVNNGHLEYNSILNKYYIQKQKQK